MRGYGILNLFSRPYFTKSEVVGGNNIAILQKILTGHTHGGLSEQFGGTLGWEYIQYCMKKL